MSVQVLKISSPEQLQQAFAIREEVFVAEQNVAKEDEYDQYEDSSLHFLALLGGEPAGTARWRFTEKGVKLERFAVRASARGKGIGQALVAAVLADIKAHPDSAGKLLYLHAQITAMGLYARFGFEKEGDIFDECGILHYKMKLQL